MSKLTVIKPHLSEKAYKLSKDGNTYVMAVPKEATKSSVAAAVKSQFSVTARKINIANIKGKPKRTVQRGGRPAHGRREDVKRAYVTLAKEDSLPFFEEVEQAAEKEKKIEEKAKKEIDKIQAEKPIEKETQPKRTLRNAFSRTPRQTQNRGGE